MTYIYSFIIIFGVLSETGNMPNPNTTIISAKDTKVCETLRSAYDQIHWAAQQSAKRDGVKYSFSISRCVQVKVF